MPDVGDFSIGGTWTAASNERGDPARPGYRSDGGWRPTTEDERGRMSTEERIAHIRSRPGYAEDLQKADQATRITRVVRDGDWQARGRAEQEANYQPARPQYPAPNPRAA